MIGTLAGDIIGSPFRFENLEDTSRFVGWNLFEENRQIHFENNKGEKLSIREFKELSPMEQKRCSFREKTHAACSTHISNDMYEVSSYLLAREKGADIPDTLSEPLAIGVCCGEYARSADEAVRLAQEIVQSNMLASHAVNDVMLSAHAVWMISHGHSVQEVGKVMTEVYGLSTASEDEHSMLLKGQLKYTDNNKKDIGDGVKTSDLSLILPAALHCMNISRSYEEAVRRAAALGGSSSLVCALTGSLAEHSFGVPDYIKSKMDGFLSVEQKDAIEVFESRSKSTAVRQSDKETIDNTLWVIRQGAKTPVYVVPEGRMDMEAAVERVNKATKRDTIIIRPEQMHEMIDSMSVNRDSKGMVLGGTYVENERPECNKLWLQDGQLKSSSTRAAIGEEHLPSVRVRSENVNKFEELKSYANDIRTELERHAGYEGPGHIHFAEAFYPVVKNRSIDLMQGDILRGRVKIDDDGKIKVDTNVNTGSNTGEYLENVLNSMDLFHKNDGVAEIKQKLNEFCLDYGKIEDEDERLALLSDDQEAESVKMKYVSNIDKAIMDMSREQELAIAEAPVLTRKEIKRIDKLAQQREESREQYAGMSRKEVENLRRYQGSVFTVGHSNYSAEEFQKLLKEFAIDTVVDIRSFPKSNNYPHFNADTLKDSLQAADIDYRYSGKEMGGHMLRTKDERFNLYMLESDTRKPEYKFFHNDQECVDYCKAINKTIPVDARFTTYMWMTDKQIEEFIASKDCSKEFAKEIQVYTGKVVTYEEAISRASFKDELKTVRELTKDGHRVAVMCMEGDPEACHRFAMVGYALAHPTDGRIKPMDVQHITRKGVLISQDYLEKKVTKAYGLSDEPKGLETAMRKKCVSLLTKTKDDQRIRIQKPVKNNSLKR